jgi:hypothetical protein
VQLGKPQLTTFNEQLIRHIFTSGWPTACLIVDDVNLLLRGYIASMDPWQLTRKSLINTNLKRDALLVGVHISSGNAQHAARHAKRGNSSVKLKLLL